MKLEMGFQSKLNSLVMIGRGSFFLFVCFSFCSCYTYGPLLQPGDPVPLSWEKESQYYIPTAFNAPMLDSAELAALSLNTRIEGSGGDGFGIDATVRLSPKWAVTGNYGLYSMGSGSYTTETHQWEFGGGYTGKVSRHWNWEAFTGLGSMKYDLQYYNGHAQVNTNYYYLQPAIYYHKSGKKPYFTIGVASRLSMQTPEVTEKNISNVNPHPFTEKQLSILESVGSLWAIEPGIVARIGWKPVQLTAQYFGIAYLNESDLHGQSSIFNLGLRFALTRSMASKK